MEWTTVCKASDVDEGMPVSAKAGATPVGVFKVGDEICALNDVCSHAFALLSQGFQDGDAIECPLHGARFDIRTGAVLSAPATEPVRSLEIRIIAGEVQVKA